MSKWKCQRCQNSMCSTYLKYYISKQIITHFPKGSNSLRIWGIIHVRDTKTLKYVFSVGICSNKLKKMSLDKIWSESKEFKLLHAAYNVNKKVLINNNTLKYIIYLWIILIVLIIIGLYIIFRFFSASNEWAIIGLGL